MKTLLGGLIVLLGIHLLLLAVVVTVMGQTIEVPRIMWAALGTTTLMLLGVHFLRSEVE